MRSLDHVRKRRLDPLPRPRFEPAVRIDPDLPVGQTPSRDREQITNSPAVGTRGECISQNRDLMSFGQLYVRNA
jgi:hypothetical protein